MASFHKISCEINVKLVLQIYEQLFTLRDAETSPREMHENFMTIQFPNDKIKRCDCNLFRA